MVEGAAEEGGVNGEDFGDAEGGLDGEGGDCGGAEEAVGGEGLEVGGDAGAAEEGSWPAMVRRVRRGAVEIDGF